MNEQELMRVAFRFTRKELGGLCRLAGFPGLPELDIQDLIPEEDTIRSLMESGTVMAAGEKILADNIIIFLIREICQSVCFLVLTGSQGKAVLYQGTKIWIMAEEKGEIVTLEPMPDRNHAWEVCREVSEKLGEPLHSVMRRNREENQTEMDLESRMEEGDGFSGMKNLFAKM